MTFEGFEKRIVYNLCKAFTAQLGAGDDYPTLNDVVAVTICDFMLWQGGEGPPCGSLGRLVAHRPGPRGDRFSQPYLPMT